MDRLDQLEEIAATLVEHARLADSRMDHHDRQIMILRDVAQQTNERVGALVSSIGDYIRFHEEREERRGGN
jgi:hypothetical protein